MSKSSNNEAWWRLSSLEVRFTSLNVPTHPLIRHLQHNNEPCDSHVYVISSSKHTQCYYHSGFFIHENKRRKKRAKHGGNAAPRLAGKHLRVWTVEGNFLKGADAQPHLGSAERSGHLCCFRSHPLPPQRALLFQVFTPNLYLFQKLHRCFKYTQQ